VPSRTCYDHLGGEIGVAIYRGLRDREALRPRADGIVELGGKRGLRSALGVELSAA
jgi:hypothetical protein